MPYAIIRCQKCSLGQVSAAERHNLRKSKEHGNKDIDTAKSHLNQTLVACPNITREVSRQVDEIQASQKRKIRKDAPRALEYIVTASPEAFETIDREKFFRDSLDFLKDRHGDSRVVSAVVHLDETTPHMHVIVVPVHDGKLSARHFMSRESLKTLQDRFGDLGQGFGLQRGQKGSQRPHFDLSEYKREAVREKERLETELSDLREKAIAPIPPVQTPKPRFLQSKADYGSEVTKSTLEQLRPHWKVIHAKALERDDLKAENDRLKEKAEALSAQVAEIDPLKNQNRELKRENDRLKRVLGILEKAKEKVPEFEAFLQKTYAEAKREVVARLSKAVAPVIQFAKERERQQKAEPFKNRYGTLERLGLPEHLSWEVAQSPELFEQTMAKAKEAQQHQRPRYGRGRSR